MRLINFVLTLQVTLTFVLARETCSKLLKRIKSDRPGHLEGRISSKINRTELKYFRLWQIELTFDQEVQFVPTDIYIHQETGIIYHPGGGASSAAAPVLSIDNPSAMNVTVRTKDNKKYILSRPWGDIDAEKLGRILAFSLTFNVTFTNPSVDVTQFTINDNVKCDGASVCGESSGTRLLVHKGKTIQHGEFPWLAAIFVRSESSLQFSCGGTLVSKKHVITAGHCVKSTDNTFRARDFIVYVGKHRLISFTQEPHTQVFAVSEVKVHVDWGARREGKRDADIAVLELADPVVFTEYVKPACIRYYEPNVSPGTRGVVVGWGEDEHGDIAQEPRAVILPFVDLATCRASDRRYENLTSDRTFCAGSKDGAGPCRGDSGGGFVTQFTLPGDKPRYELTGVVSIALVKKDYPEMCDLGSYSIFTLIKEFRFWLRDDNNIPTSFDSF